LVDFTQLHSFLFVPLSDPRVLHARLYERAAREAHALILDLEDSLARKEEGRALLFEALESFRPLNSRLIVRINNDGNWLEDLRAAAASPHLHAVLVPKVEHLEHLTRVTGTLQALGLAHIPVLPLIETAKGILLAETILKLQKAPPCIVFDCENMASDLEVMEPTLLSMKYPAQHLILLGAAHRVPVIGNIASFSSFAIETAEAFRTSILQSRETGFSGCLALHPTQIGIINSVFSYEREREYLEDVVNAAVEDKPVFSLKGRIFGPPMLRRYRRLLDKGD
jgi:citrate lyase subunit beta/citryl-CoA lyase